MDQGEPQPIPCFVSCGPEALTPSSTVFQMTYLYRGSIPIRNDTFRVDFGRETMWGVFSSEQGHCKCCRLGCFCFGKP